MWFHSLIIGLLMFANMATIQAASIPFGWIKNPKPDVYILGGNIGLTMQNYHDLEQRLLTATSKDRIYIILYDNAGGMAYIEDELHNAITQSLATVTTEARLWTASAALDVLFSGEYVYIKKQPQVNRFIPIGVAHLSFIPGPNGAHLRTQGSINSDIQEMQYYRNFLSEDEWRRVTEGEDVYLYANTLCANAKVKTEDTADHCVIKNDHRFRSLRGLYDIFNF